MHSQIPQHHKDGSKYRQPHTIHPQRLDIEPETAEDGGAGDLDVDAVFVVGEGEVFHLIDDESFEGEVEYRELDMVHSQFWYHAKVKCESGNWWV